MAVPTPIPFERTFDALYGLELVEPGEDLVRARIPVHDEVRQPGGIVHGGVYAAAAEALASMATHLAVAQAGKVAMGLSNQTSFLRPISGGHVHAEARPRHRGRSTWVWEVEFVDDQQRLCALSRVTVAIRDPEG